jgi:hypothetical protein
LHHLIPLGWGDFEFFEVGVRNGLFVFGGTTPALTFSPAASEVGANGEAIAHFLQRQFFTSPLQEYTYTSFWDTPRRVRSVW